MMPFYRSGGTDGIGDYPESMSENPLGGGDLRERPSLPFQNSLLVQGERTTEQIGIVEEKPRHVERRVNPADLLSRTLGKAQQAGVMPVLSRLLPRRWERSPACGRRKARPSGAPGPGTFRSRGKARYRWVSQAGTRRAFRPEGRPVARPDADETPKEAFDDSSHFVMGADAGESPKEADESSHVVMGAEADESSHVVMGPDAGETPKAGTAPDAGSFPETFPDGWPGNVRTAEPGQPFGASGRASALEDAACRSAASSSKGAASRRTMDSAPCGHPDRHAPSPSQ